MQHKWNLHSLWLQKLFSTVFHLSHLILEKSEYFWVPVVLLGPSFVVVIQLPSHAQLWPQGLKHTRLPCPSPSPRACPSSCLLNWWCHPTISSSVIFFSSYPQSLPASGSFPMSQLFVSGSQSIGVSASTSVLPMNTQDWSPLGRTGWISLQSKGLSRVFSNTTVQKHQSLGAQPSLCSIAPIYTWLHLILAKRPRSDYTWLLEKP